MNRSNRKRMVPSSRRSNESAYKSVSRVATRIPNRYLSRIDSIPGGRYAATRMLIIKGLEAYEAQNTPKQ